MAKSSLCAFELHLGGPHRVARGLRQQLGGEIHQPLIIGIRLVKLQHGELGVVLRGKPLIAKVAVDLVDALQPAHHQPLQIQLRRDAQVEIDIERIVVRHERARRGAAIKRLHHRRFHFDETPRFELPPQRRDDPRARHEHLAHFGVRDQIQIPLPVARLHVLQPVPLLGHRQQRLREELELLRVNAQFARAGAEKVALHAHDIAHIEQLEELVIALADGVLLDIDLQPLAILLQMREARLCPCGAASSIFRRCARGPPASIPRPSSRRTPPESPEWCA